MEPVEFDDSIQDTTTIVGAIVIVIAVTCVALRFYTRRITRAGLGWDDWLVLLALVITIVSAILLFVASSIDPNGAKAASNTDPDYVYTPADVAYTRLDFIVTVLYFTVTSATKLSILLMYRRIFGVNRSFRRRVFVVSLVVGGFWIGTTVADLLNCIPLQWSWLNSHDDPRYCFNYTIFWLASGIVEAILDVIILTLPIQSVLGLHLKTSRKVAIGGVFLLGSLVIVSGIVKVVLSYEPGNREPSFSKTEVWSSVHVGVAIVCACLPICWPLFVKLAKACRSWPMGSQMRKLRYSISAWPSIDRRGPPRDDSITRTSSCEGFELPSDSAR